MRLGKLNNPNKLVFINPKKYLIDWENDGSSKPEICFRDLIYPYWKNYIILFQFRIPGSRLRIDFFNLNKKLIVEIDGSQHDKFNKHFHNNSRNNYLNSIKRDLDKEKWCEENNIKVLRLNEQDLFNFSISYVEKNYNINIL
jgi:Protein of unknown function (DUF559)